MIYKSEISDSFPLLLLLLSLFVRSQPQFLTACQHQTGSVGKRIVDRWELYVSPPPPPPPGIPCVSVCWLHCCGFKFCECNSFQGWLKSDGSLFSKNNWQAQNDVIQRWILATSGFLPPPFSRCPTFVNPPKCFHLLSTKDRSLIPAETEPRP